jgi:hypothetical protein
MEISLHLGAKMNRQIFLEMKSLGCESKKE